MPLESQNFGKLGEKEAELYLKEKGFEIVERNWRFKKLEVDLIAKDNKELVFIEVKARGTDYFGDPESFVSKKKQKNLIAAANNYITETNFNGETRFDVVAILQNNDKILVNHIQNAFSPSII